MRATRGAIRRGIARSVLDLLELATASHPAGPRILGYLLEVGSRRRVSPMRRGLWRAIRGWWRWPRAGHGAPGAPTCGPWCTFSVCDGPRCRGSDRLLARPSSCVRGRRRLARGTETSAPPWVISRTRAGTSPSLASIVSTAPSSRALPSFRSSRSTAMTRAPSAAATCTAESPIPPQPLTTTQSPPLTSPRLATP